MLGVGDFKKQIVGLKNFFLAVFLFVLILRTFFLTTFCMPSSQMETSIIAGECVLVNKIAYGIRMPICPLSIPFVPDSLPLLGIHSYISLWTLPYARLLTKVVDRNDIVVYNIPSPDWYKPLDKTPVAISRCVALPGDSVEMRNGVFFINGQEQLLSPQSLTAYSYNASKDSLLHSFLRQLKIPLRSIPMGGETSELVIYLSKFEVYILGEEFPQMISYLKDFNTNHTYKFLLPAKNLQIDLDEKNWSLYKEIIAHNERGRAEYKDGNFYIAGQSVKEYVFDCDYYWMLSDNVDVSTDSRHYGFISHKQVIGKVENICYSKIPGTSLVDGYRWERFFADPN